MEKSIYTKIIDREMPGVFVHEDDDVVAFMNRFPKNPGEVIVVPRKQIEYIFDVEDELYGKLWLTAKTIGKAIDTALSPCRVCIVVEGFEMPHVHIKLFPVPEGKELTLDMGDMQEDEPLQEMADKIKAAL